MSLSAQIFGRDSFIHRATNVLGLGVPTWLDKKFGPQDISTSPTIPTVQDSAYGNYIPRFHGKFAPSGNLLWLKGGKLDVTTKHKSGGKGGQSTAQTTYSYFATFALALGEGPIAGIRRIWCGDKLIYNSASDDLETIVASNQAAKGWKFYRGTDDQLPDPDIQADKGVENTPAYRGLAYIKFKKFALKNYGDSLAGAQFKVELLTDFGYDVVTVSAFSPSVDILYPIFKEGSSLSSVRTYNGSAASTTWSVYEHYLGKSIYDGTINRSAYMGDLPRRVVGNINTFLTATNNAGFNVDGTLYPTARFGIGWLNYDVVYDDANTRLFALGRDGSSNRRLVMMDRLGADIQAASGSIKSIALGDGYVWGITNSSIIQMEMDDLSVVATIPISPANALPSGDATYISYSDGIIYLFPFMSAAGPQYRSLMGFDAATGEEVVLEPDFPDIGYIGSSGAPAAIYDGVIFQAGLGGPNAGIRFLTYDRVISNTLTLGDVVSREIQLSELLSVLDFDTSLLTQQLTGYRLAGGSVRDGLEPLRAAWPFDARMHGYKLQFLPRGQASAGVIPWGDLAATDGDEIGDSLPYDREMDTQLPAKVTAKG
ncbi:hypothetical protein [Pseudomonas denitrificans (nom. rej.)]|uniref:Phage tail protein n=1 Tax=Pseudomonas denitrificans TaxID=43306 RepID=A0A9X7MVX9_PSEDE|nr:hypothetical protein [Pseudomonas denitrificans (nom. rej.)]QEY70516.1 hypothetical protein F1C79_01920 [Pseudomonas denitrificans (nom. rej.)]